MEDFFIESVHLNLESCFIYDTHGWCNRDGWNGYEVLNEVDDENEQNCIEASVENVDGDIPMMVIPTNSFSINCN